MSKRLTLRGFLTIGHFQQRTLCPDHFSRAVICGAAHKIRSTENRLRCSVLVTPPCNISLQGYLAAKCGRNTDGIDAAWNTPTDRDWRPSLETIADAALPSKRRQNPETPLKSALDTSFDPSGRDGSGPADEWIPRRPKFHI